MANQVQKLYECQWTQEGCAPAKVTARGCLIQQVTKQPREGGSTWYPCATCATGQQMIRDHPELKASIDDHIRENGQSISRRQQGLSAFPCYPTNNEAFASINMTSAQVEPHPSPPKSSQAVENPALISKYGPSILVDLDGIIKKDGTATRRSLLERLNLSLGSLKYHLKNLEKAGFLIITPGRWATDEIKLDFAEKGRAYILSQNGGNTVPPAEPAAPSVPNRGTCKTHGLPFKLSAKGNPLWGCIKCFQEWAALGNKTLRAKKADLVPLDLSPYPELRQWLETSRQESLRADLAVEAIYWLRKIMSQETSKQQIDNMTNLLARLQAVES